MAQDLKIDIDGTRLNIRVGAILRHEKEVLIEISTIGRNSVVPGGRIKINESSANALARELKEETGLEIDTQKLSQIKVFENFFKYDGQDVHEIYFLYEYILNENEYTVLSSLSENKDNDTTYFKFVQKQDLGKYNLLPLDLFELI